MIIAHIFLLFEAQRDEHILFFIVCIICTSIIYIIPFRHNSGFIWPDNGNNNKESLIKIEKSKGGG